MITISALTTIMPGATPKAGSWTNFLNAAMERFEINTPKRQAAFLAQGAHESMETTRLEEVLSYSPERILKVWPNRFKTIEEASKYAFNPIKLANYVYANRIGNGDEASGDGYKFRGRGLIQITGRANYKKVGDALGIDLISNPDLLLDPEYAALSAAFFFKEWNCNTLADKNQFSAISMKICGSFQGTDSRNKYHFKAQNVLMTGGTK